MSETRILDLDFDTIKNNLKNFLKSQATFSDYNFEGSGLAVLLDVLAYNTHYNAVLAHLTANEMFLDSAIKRSSVVSHAKALGYIPRSAVASTAVVDIVVTPTGIPTNSLTLDTSVAFEGRASDETFTFYPAQVYNADYDPEAGTYTFLNVRLKEGTRSLSRFVIGSDTGSGPLTLENQNIDISTLQVSVFENSTTLISDPYKYSNTIIDVDEDAKVFWVEETPTGRYALLFGDDIIGKKLSVGNVVNANYLVCAGDGSANGVRNFILSGTISGYTNVSLRIVQSSAGGAPPESIDSIRFNAPRHNATRNRAVTIQDYKSLLLANYPYIKGISVWGGEENNPPIYGKVFISIDPQDGYVVTDSEQEYIINSILKPRSMLGIQHEFVDPDYLYIGLEVVLNYDSMRTKLSASAIEALVREEINKYFNNEVSTLADTFHYSRLIRYIDASTPAIISSQVALKLHKRVEVILNSPTFVNINFITKIEPGSVMSSNFMTTVNDTSKRVYLKDNSDGSLCLHEVGTDTLLEHNVGTIDYETGQVVILELLKTGSISNVSEIRFYATPEELNYNISPAIITKNESSTVATYPYPAQNIVLKLDTSTPVVSAGVIAGLTVQAKTING